MLLTLRTTHTPATDLGWLLHKNPERLQTFSLSFGLAHVFYPERTEAACTAALLLEVDPIDLARGAEGRDNQPLWPYVNDRPYVASSFLSTALAQVFGTAMSGRCKARPELEGLSLPLEIHLPALPSKGGAAQVRRLFEPLGYTVEAEELPLDPAFPAWGRASAVRVTLQITAPLSDVLTHLYVLVPALDGEKHYWVGHDELEKLLAKGEGWLSTHPSREWIVSRYLRRARPLIAKALAQLAEGEPDPEGVEDERQSSGAGEAALEAPAKLNDVRMAQVVEILGAHTPATVVDLGCGEGRLLQRLLRAPWAPKILGVDVSPATLTIAERRLKLDRLPQAERDRLVLYQGSALYKDTRLAGADAVALVEVIEHLDGGRLPDLERVVWGWLAPKVVLVTTPNASYNAVYGMPAGKMRHADHRFEWDRPTFEAWAQRVAAAFGYDVRFHPIGPVDDTHGAPTQAAEFVRCN